MDIERMVAMVNEIAAFFVAAEHSEREAVNAIATHLTRYWAPTMRREICSYAQQDGAALSAVAHAAIARLNAATG